MSDLKNITINDVPLKTWLDGKHREEISSHRKDETKEISFVVSHSRSASTSGFRNHSGSRTGRGRIIMMGGVNV
jgi:hypothetical protein